MRLPWQKPNTVQLDLLGDEPEKVAAAPRSEPIARAIPPASSGHPCMVPIPQIDEDPANPRAEFPEQELEELAQDIHMRGILVPLVVHSVDSQGRYLLHFGARRLRAAVRAGLNEVPVIVRDVPADRYAQVAENLKRSALSPLDLARFIRQQIDAGDSHAEVSRRLGMNLTTVSHHLSLLELPPVLADALASGRCTSPRTLHELSKLSESQPEKVRSLVEGQGALTRDAVASLRAEVPTTAAAPAAPAMRRVSQAVAACEKLERLLARIAADDVSPVDLANLRDRVEALVRRLPQGSDSQTAGV